MKVYVAGPMRGIPECNFPAFDAAQLDWEAEGWQVFSPARCARSMGYHPDHGDYRLQAGREQLKHVMALDVCCIHASDAVAVLPGWEGSVGATVEVALAQFLHLTVYDAVTHEVLSVRACPWATRVRVLTGETIDAAECTYCGSQFNDDDPGVPVVDDTGRVALCGACAAKSS